MEQCSNPGSIRIGGRATMYAWITSQELDELECAIEAEEENRAESSISES